MGHLYFLVGLPRSGKSKLADLWVKHHISFKDGLMWDQPLNGYDFNPRVIVCGDQIRLALHGQRFQAQAEKHVHAIKYTMTKALLMSHSVLLDETNTTLSHIKEILFIDPDAQYCLIDETPEECKRRALECKQDDLLPVIDRMYNNLIKWKDNHLEEINRLRDEVRQTLGLK